MGWGGCEPGDVDEDIPFHPPRGLFQHYSQVEKHLVTPDPGSLCVGQYVICVLADSVMGVRRGAMPQVGGLGFRMGAILGVNRAAQQITVAWWSTVENAVSRASHVWRPWLGPQGKSCTGVVAVDEVAFTFRKLTSAGRMWVAEFRSMQYILECRKDQQEVEMARIHALAEMAQRHAQDEYLDDVVGDDRDATDHHARYLRKEEAQLHEEIVVGEVKAAAKAKSKETQKQVSEGEEEEVEDIDEIDCPGYEDCECNFDHLLQDKKPGDPLFAVIYAHNWNRIAEIARDSGEKWIKNSNCLDYSTRRAAEWDRMNALNVQGRTRRRRG